MTSWATIDTDILIRRRDEKLAELRAFLRMDARQIGVNEGLRAAKLSGTIDALDVIIEATKPNSVAGGVA
ncbi:hypothetical protein [Agrobacterium sp. MS2]|uniref:hypothetical protein n=1 Tax=Agrobacterium sp. MS2 TaxID=1345498 RepID=UPI000DBFEF8E|nr:hypothetical protein [Agrobacterium sp. MS2]RAL98686.1 hypothetical protein DOU54_06400 [Agrobacterium sp. MS2]